MDEASLDGLIPTGYMLVPWASWDQWNFVRESLFSSIPDSIAAALRRIAAWQSKGCLPIAIQVTASIIETQQKDSFFRKGLSGDTTISEDMLVMLYSMAIMRLVNGFVEKTNGFDNIRMKNAPQTKRHSIFEIADSIGIPRMLTDIRHESSHSNLPSLSLLRLASTEAISWLQSHYWEPQRRMIPDAKKEIRTRIHQMACCVKLKHEDQLKSSQIKARRIKQPGIIHVSNKLSSKISQKLLSSKTDGFRKQISRNSKIITRLYSVYPAEVISSLLETFMSQTTTIFPKNELDCNDDTRTLGQFDAFKEITTELSRKKPELLLTVLKEVLRMIEDRNTLFERGDYLLQSSEAHANICQIEQLSSLVSWLVSKLKELKKAERIGLTDDPQNISMLTNLIPRISLTEVLRRCLHLSASGNKQLSESAMFLADMIADETMIEKLRNLPSPSFADLDFTMQELSSQRMEFHLSEEETCLNQAAKTFEALKSQLKSSSKLLAAGNGTKEIKKRWTLTKSWTACPIGMLPSSFGSTPILPSLDNDNNFPDKKEKDMNENIGNIDTSHGKRESRLDSDELSEHRSPCKKPKETCNSGVQVAVADTPNVPSPVEGMLFIGGVWTKVGKEEIAAIESNVRILISDI